MDIDLLMFGGVTIDNKLEKCLYEGLVSVVMPVYNEAPVLQRSIESILCQTYPNFELIIVNESESTDDSRHIIEEYAKHDLRIKFIQKEHEGRGIAISRNLGIYLAKGEYIAFLDADDFAYPNRLEVQVEYMKKHSVVDICCTYCRQIWPNHEEYIKGELISEDIAAMLLFRNIIPNPTVMFRREKFVKNKWFFKEDCLAEDYELWNRIIGEATFARIPEVLVDYYFGWGNNISLSRGKEIMHDVRNFVLHNLRKKVHIKTELYSSAVLDFFMGNVTGCVTDIFDAYKFLADIESANEEIKVVDRDAIGRVLCQEWYRYLYSCGIYGALFNSNFLPVPDNKAIRFNEALQQILENENVYTSIEYILKTTRVSILSMHHFVVFSTGIISRNYIEKNRNVLSRILCFCDNNIEKCGKLFFNKKIISPTQLSHISYDKILIATGKYYDEIYTQLVNLYRVPKDKIMPIGVLGYIGDK